ncbi:MAG: hypothetical protein HY828_02470 [Actinobacteria bacterium]|nr:hypothetical protein [Actinomycetota bacterium]
MAAPSIERTILLDDLAMSSDELWRLVATAEGWREWLVDEADIDVRDGAAGDVVDDGVRRAVRIGSVLHGEQISFVWSSDDTDLSHVTLRIQKTDDGRRALHITEVPIAACAQCPMRVEAVASRWDLRECLLCLAAHASSRV